MAKTCNNIGAKAHYFVLGLPTWWTGWTRLGPLSVVVSIHQCKKQRTLQVQIKHLHVVPDMSKSWNKRLVWKWKSLCHIFWLWFLDIIKDFQGASFRFEPRKFPLAKPLMSDVHILICPVGEFQNKQCTGSFCITFSLVLNDLWVLWGKAIATVEGERQQGNQRECQRGATRSHYCFCSPSSSRDTD